MHFKLCYWVAKPNPSRNLAFISCFFVVTVLPDPVGIWVSFRGFFILLFLSLFFSVSGKVLPVTPLLSGVFVHTVFCAYFVRFEGDGVIRRFPW